MRDSESGHLVIVRAYQAEHIDKLYEAVEESISELSRYETWCHPGYSRSEAGEYVNWWREMWEQKRAYYFAIEELDAGLFLGSCGLSGLSTEHKRAGLGFRVRQSRTNECFATVKAAFADEKSS